MMAYFTRRNLFFSGLSFLFHAAILFLIYNLSFKNHLPSYQRTAFQLLEANLKNDVQVSGQVAVKRDLPAVHKSIPVVKEAVSPAPDKPSISTEPLEQTSETKSTTTSETVPVATRSDSGSAGYKADTLKNNSSGKDSDQEMQNGIIDAASNSINVEKLFAPLPSYPEKAVDLDGSGNFEILIIIDTQGGVSDIKILSEKVSGNSELLKSIFTDEILRVVKKWKFKPVRFKNRPVSVAVKCPVEFKQERSDYN